MTYHNTGIYEIRNTVNGKRYVGSAVRFCNRWRVHAQSLKRGDHHSQALQRAWNLYGSSAFQFNKLVACSKENLLMYEQIFLDAYAPEYNIAKIAGSQLGVKRSDEVKAKNAEAARRTRNFTGHKHTDESKAKISASRSGKGGGERSAERRANISAALKGRIITQEQRVKISAKLTGHKQSPEQIAKRMANMPPGHYEKVAASKRKYSAPDIQEVKRLLKVGVMNYRLISEATGVGRWTVADIACGRKYKEVS